MIRKILKSKEGNSTILTISIILTILLITLVVSEFFRIVIIVSGIREALQSAVISVSISNYDEVYSGLREGYSGGYIYENNSWCEKLDYGDVYNRLDELLGTEEINDKHIKGDENNFEFRLSDLKINIDNTSFAPNSGNKKFHADIYIKTEIPFQFFNDISPNIKLKIKTSAEYLPKF